MKKVNIGVRDFALPVPRTGSIDINSGYGSVSSSGLEIHSAVQLERANSFSNYRSEVRISRAFERQDFKFIVSGQMDGIFDSNEVLIEEIKTSFSLSDLAEKLQDRNHPYCLQLKTYGYFYALNEGKVPTLKFLLVSSRNRSDQEEIFLPFELSEYEEWLNKRLDECVVAAQVKEDDQLRRKMIARNLCFPFEQMRPKQQQLIAEIENNFDAEAILVQAPTGLGKTAGVMFPTLKESLSRGQKLIYVTPKNSQHAVAEEAIKKFQTKQRKLRSLTLNAKARMCLKNEQICQPDSCEYAKDYYKKVDEADLVNKMSKHRHLSSQKIKQYGEQYEVCPFELSIDCIERTDIVVGDYNYVFSPRSLIGRFSSSTNAKKDRPNLIIDEAHNLPTRSCDYYSAVLSTEQLNGLLNAIAIEDNTFKSEASRLIRTAIKVIEDCKSRVSGNGGQIARLPISFQQHEDELREFVSRYFESNIQIKQSDPILRYCSLWFDFCSTSQFEGDNFFLTVESERGNCSIKVTCCDASAQLSLVHANFLKIVAFSATLKPFPYYAKLCGFNEAKTKTIEFTSPFPKKNRKIMVIPQVSTKFSEREKNYQKIAVAISKIVQVREGNYFVFFPSFAFLNAVSRLCQFDRYKVIYQTAGMKPKDVLDCIESLREHSQPTLVFAVQGGVFSEGVDYPGEALIGAIIVGPALPSYNLERELLREYYEKTYGSGFDYAYSYPAMAKAIQSAGRVIRSETDKGLIVLMDRRFTEETYTKTMPEDWFDSSVTELVSTSILSDIDCFWKGL